MKYLFCTLFACLLLTESTSAQVMIEKRRPAQPGKELYVENSFGSITVRGWDKNEVLVRGELAAGAEGLEFDSDDEGIYVSVEVPDAWFYASEDDSDYRSVLEIFVPSQTSVGVETVNAGIEILDTQAEIEVETVNGNVRIDGANTGIEVETMTGDIQVTASGAPMGVESISGSVFLKGAGKEVSVSTVSAPIEVMGQGIESLEIESTSGPVTFQGTLATEGEMEIETFSGDVILVLVPGVQAHFELTTFGGAISSDLGPKTRSSDRFTPHKKLRFTTGSQDFDITVDTHSANITLQIQESQ